MIDVYYHGSSIAESLKLPYKGKVLDISPRVFVCLSCSQVRPRPEYLSVVCSPCFDADVKPFERPWSVAAQFLEGLKYLRRISVLKGVLLFTGPSAPSLQKSPQQQADLHTGFKILPDTLDEHPCKVSLTYQRNKHCFAARMADIENHMTADIVVPFRTLKGNFGLRLFRRNLNYLQNNNRNISTIEFGAFKSMTQQRHSLDLFILLMYRLPSTQGILFVPS